jgi:hypothetical protein
MTNEWILYTDYLNQCSKGNTEEYRFWTQSSIKVEYMSDGKIHKRNWGGRLVTQKSIDSARKYAEQYGDISKHVDEPLGKIVVWNEDNDDYEYIDASTYYIRMNQKQFDKYVKLKEIIKIGDFVRFSGTKGRYAWRQVIAIEGNTIYGRCAYKPDESTLAFYSSDNGILTAMEVIRNGEKIF